MDERGRDYQQLFASSKNSARYSGREISSVRESLPHQPQRGGDGDAALRKMNA